MLKGSCHTGRMSEVLDRSSPGPDRAALPVPDGLPASSSILADALAGLTFMSGSGRIGLVWHAFRDENGEMD
jgi:hypothetical protein